MLDENDVQEAFQDFDEEGSTGNALYRHGYLNDRTYIRVVFKWIAVDKIAFIITAYPI